MEPVAAFKDLVIDAVDAHVAGRFWAAAIGLELSDAGSGDVVLRDGVAEHTLWVNQVPEARQVKQRVHLDVFTPSVDQLVALGATVDTVRERWTVLRDPEGGEFCAFVRDPATLGAYRVYEVSVDAGDAEAICRWWGERFGITPQHDAADPWWWLPSGEPARLPWNLVFDPVPEPKRVKNRLHWDIWGHRDDLLAAGATLLRPHDEEIGWDVLADPAGNEFCVFSPAGR